ncbi:MAG TPA: acyl-CoA dehydrogenase [Gammaproteobacteria bacterium]|nr:acyl-CoA dehydrogenase [Gammaproteobacteria bacterium]
MAAIFWAIIAVGGAVILAYRRASLITATLSAAALIIAYTFVGDSGWLKLFWWALFICAAALFNSTELRRRWLTEPLFDLFRKVMPEVSETERAALDSGSVWWDGELFSGRPDWDRLLSTPAPAVSPEEQAFLDGPTDELCAMLDEWQITHELGDLPPNVWAFIKERGFFSMIISKDYGGLDFSAVAVSQVLTKIATRSPTAASIVSVPNSLGPAELLLRYGTQEQKDHYLPALAKGEAVPCFALTGPTAGSDAGAIEDTGIVCRGDWHGEEVLGLRLNWNKRYITLAPIATLLGLAFKLYDPDHLIGEQDEYGITCALIPPDLPGVTIGRRHFPINIPFQNGPTEGHDVFVPLDAIIGGQEMAGHGWRMLTECLAAGRSISLPSSAVGSAKLSVFASGAYARIRKQFRLPIAKFGGVEEVLGRMGGTLYAMDAVRLMTAGANDLGETPAVPSAIAKYHVTEMGRDVVNDAMDVHGGKGIQLGPRNYLARPYEAVPIAITVEGANILTRSMIIFGQGAIRSHPYVLTEMEAVADDDRERGIERFDDAFTGHVGFTLSNAARSLWMGLTHARFTTTPGDAGTRRYYQQLNRYSAAFALAADVTMSLLGGGLKKREKISGRLGDVLSYLYIASAVLKRYEDQGRQREDLPLVEWACRDALYKLQEQIHSLLRNFPNRWAALLLRVLIFPTGRTFSAPSDALTADVADLITQPGPARDRLTAGVYDGDRNGPIGLMSEALALAVQAEPLEKRLHQAVRDGTLPRDDGRVPLDQAEQGGVIDADEAALLRRLEELTAEIVAVDDFAPDEIGRKPLSKTRKQAARKRSAATADDDDKEPAN